MRNRRTLPLAIFAVLEWATILSLINAPGPLITGRGGYTESTIALSSALGVFLAIVALGSTLGRWLSFRLHMGILIATGLFCWAASLFILPDSTVPRAIFAVYGLILVVGSLLVERPQEENAKTANVIVPMSESKRGRLRLTSPGFEAQSALVPRYASDGLNLSPPLRWSNVPSGTREFALICEDPDAQGREPFVHWLIYDISPSVTSLPEGLLKRGRMELPVIATQGKNSFGHIGYDGPLPPIGHPRHRYVFKLYALDFELGVRPGASKQELLKAMKGHVLAETQLIGTYERVLAQRNIA